LRFVTARMAHNHVEQYPAGFRILTDHAIRFAREYPLTTVAKVVPHSFLGGQQCICRRGVSGNLDVDDVLRACEKYEAVLLFKQAMSRYCDKTVLSLFSQPHFEADTTFFQLFSLGLRGAK
jgi:hypothetical protein